MQYREYLANHWPDLEKKEDKWYKSLDKLAVHVPEWVLELWLNSPDLDAFLLFHQLRDTTPGQ